MKGHIRERSPGHWAIVLDIRDPETGKRKRKWHSFSGTKREAQIERSRLVTEFAQGSYVEPSKTTLAAFLDQWLTHIEPQVAPRTHERYKEIARKNLVPLLGQTVLTKLRPEQIATAYSKALRSGRRDGSGGLSARTVHHMHRILKQALAIAVRWRMLAHNPVDSVDPPKVERRKMAALDAQKTARLLAHFRNTRMFAPVLLAVMCGLRRGEITALRWASIDLVRRQLSVVECTEQTTKGVRFKETKSGRSRTVALPAPVVDELRRVRLAQAEELLRVGVRLTDQTHVVAQVDGQPLQPNSLTHEFVRLLAKASDQPRIRFHDLRHTHATHLLSNGVHPKVAQERLGHSSVGITLDLYSHVLPGMQEDAAARVDAAIRAAIDAPETFG
jgi:integrase